MILVGRDSYKVGVTAERSLCDNLICDEERQSTFSYKVQTVAVRQYRALGRRPSSNFEMKKKKKKKDVSKNIRLYTK